ncbi:hypothetical protein LG314_10220 [Agrococcus terreus]|uniref:hypothetical protein n=1 Tax=Agrococcus terreus TaxID=574649 RepID=UPI00384E5BDC
MSEADAPRQPRAGRWASKVYRLHVADEQRAHAFNVDGKRVAGPQQGFGPLWDRTYSVRIGAAATPEQVVARWRVRFGDYWPRSGTFHGRIAALEAGDVSPLTAGGITTGVLVIYADDTSFSFITPEGHMFGGLITFSARDEGGTLVEIRMLVRTADPSWQLLWPAIKPAESWFWKGTLTNLAADHGVAVKDVDEVTVCVDPRPIWRNWRNLARNGAAATAVHALGRPFRRAARA